MRLRNKVPQKEELQKKIEDLESSVKQLTAEIELKTLQLEEKPELQDNNLINAILDNELLTYIIYNHNNQKIIFASEPVDFFGIEIGNNLSNFLAIIHSDEREKVQALFKNIGKTGNSSANFKVQNSVSKENKEQQTYRFTLKNKPLEQFNKNEYLITVQNITKELKKKKEIIRGKEKAEESDKLKNIFLAKISQYIRTPMNSIVGFSELLTIYDPGEKQRREFLDIIKRQSKTLLNIVNDIAEIARYSAGDIEIKKTVIDLNLVLKELIIGLEQLRPEKRKNEVKIVTEFPNDKSFKLFSDSGRIQQIVANIANHLLCQIDNGDICISYNLPLENRFDIIIKTNAAFIPREQQKDYFNQYTYSENESTSKYDESGIGLAIAKVVIKAMGGKISLESDENLGTKFIVTLPYETVTDTNNENTELEPIENSKYDFKDNVILIVDDEEVNIMFLEAVISNTQAKTIFAKNGYEAIELCKTIPKIDLILMDILMPGMNGIKTTAEIRKFNPTIPIIAQTALNEAEDHENCIKAGCNNTITKPIEVERLLSLLDIYLSVI